MFTGVALYFGYTGVLKRVTSFLTAAAILAAFIATWRFQTIGIPFFLAWNYILAFLLFSVAMYLPKAMPKNRVTDFLANISYPLYVIHGVAGYTLLAVLKETGLRSSLSLVLVTATALGLSYIVHILIERPSTNWSKKGSETSRGVPA